MSFGFQSVEATTLAIALIVFTLTTLWSIIKTKSGRKRTSDKRKNEPAFEDQVKADFSFILAILGTGSFGVALVLYILLTYINNLSLFDMLSLQSFIPFSYYFHLSGLGMIVFGFLFFSWSIVVRTRASASREMPVSRRLVTRGPFKVVRHPSYFSYCLSFIGIFLLWPNALSIITLLGIPGYYSIARQEEIFLLAQFGNAYQEYQKHVGFLLPRLRREKKNLKK